MKARELIAQLQKLIEEHPETDPWISVKWTGSYGNDLERPLIRTRFRMTNGSLPKIVLSTVIE